MPFCSTIATRRSIVSVGPYGLLSAVRLSAPHALMDMANTAKPKCSENFRINSYFV
jgi:hypothetical protein